MGGDSGWYVDSGGMLSVGVMRVEVMRVGVIRVRDDKSKGLICLR